MDVVERSKCMSIASGSLKVIEERKMLLRLWKKIVIAISKKSWTSLERLTPFLYYLIAKWEDTTLYQKYSYAYHLHRFKEIVHCVQQKRECFQNALQAKQIVI